jgi:hypothetical protein
VTEGTLPSNQPIMELLSVRAQIQPRKMLSAVSLSCRGTGRVNTVAGMLAMSDGSADECVMDGLTQSAGSG